MPFMNTFRRPNVNKYTYTCAVLSSMALILVSLGQFVSIIRTIEPFSIDDPEKSFVLLLIMIIVSPIASLAAGRTSDMIGRRYTLLLSLILFFFGYLTKSLPGNYAVFFLGQIFVATGVGFAQMVTPIYVFELSPDSTRGFLTSFVEVFKILGTLISEIFSYFVNESNFLGHLSWRVVLRIGVIFSFLLSVCVIFLPESPVWLVSRGKLGEAKRVLAKTSENSEAAELRLASLKSALDIPELSQDDSVLPPKRRSFARSLKELLRPSVRRALIAAVGLNFFRLATGVDVITGFRPLFLVEAGINNSQTELLIATIAVRLISICLVFIAGFLIDRIGRRPLLLTGVAGMIPSLAGLGLDLKGSGYLKSKKICNVALAMSLSFSAFFEIGLGPITWVYSLEIFPFTLWDLGGSIGTAVNLLTRGVIWLTFFCAYLTIQTGGFFLVCAGVASVGWLYIYKLVPETRCGVSPESNAEITIGDQDHVARSEVSINSDLESTFEQNMILMDIKKLQKSATFPPCKQFGGRYQYLVGIRSE